jgi:hypothetical protein
MEWAIALDNSGSMCLHENDVRETLALVIEFLRKIECRFAVARFGSDTPGSQKVDHLTRCTTAPMYPRDTCIQLSRPS